jgi:hypothetical protein
MSAPYAFYNGSQPRGRGDVLDITGSTAGNILLKTSGKVKPGVDNTPTLFGYTFDPFVICTVSIG